MNCTVHPQNVATAYCRTCGKALCVQCQHNVRGVIYCEDCLAARLGDIAPAGIEQPGVQPTVSIPPAAARAADAPSPGLAAFLGFIPGVGAMYNGQFGKAIAHLFIFIALCWAAGENGWFGLMIPFWIFYMVFDAYRTAHARELGLPAPQDPFGFETWWMSDSARAAQTQAAQAVAGSPAAGTPGSATVPSPERRDSSVPIGAIVLIAVGAIFLLSNMGFFPVWRIHEFWPIVLIAIGVWLFTKRSSRYSCSCNRCQTRGLMGPAVLVTLGTMFLLDTTRVWPVFGHRGTFPVLLIVIGAVLIVRRGASGEGHVQYVPPPGPVPPPPPAPPAAPTDANATDMNAEVHNG